MALTSTSKVALSVPSLHLGLDQQQEASGKNPAGSTLGKEQVKDDQPIASGRLIASLIRFVLADGVAEPVLSVEEDSSHGGRFRPSREGDTQHGTKTISFQDEKCILAVSFHGRREKYIF